MRALTFTGEEERQSCMADGTWGALPDHTSSPCPACPLMPTCLPLPPPLALPSPCACSRARGRLSGAAAVRAGGAPQHDRRVRALVLPATAAAAAVGGRVCSLTAAPPPLPNSAELAAPFYNPRRQLHGAIAELIGLDASSGAAPEELLLLSQTNLGGGEVASYCDLKVRGVRGERASRCFRRPLLKAPF